MAGLLRNSDINWILAKFFFGVFMERDGVEVHKLAQKKNKANIQPSHLTKQAWSIKNLLYGFRGNFSCGLLTKDDFRTTFEPHSMVIFLIKVRRSYRDLSHT